MLRACKGKQNKTVLQRTVSRPLFSIIPVLDHSERDNTARQKGVPHGFSVLIHGRSIVRITRVSTSSFQFADYKLLGSQTVLAA